jgi:hypothetical protein
MRTATTLSSEDFNTLSKLLLSLSWYHNVPKSCWTALLCSIHPVRVIRASSYNNPHQASVAEQVSLLSETDEDFTERFEIYSNCGGRNERLTRLCLDPSTSLDTLRETAKLFESLPRWCWSMYPPQSEIECLQDSTERWRQLVPLIQDLPDQCGQWLRGLLVREIPYEHIRPMLLALVEIAGSNPQSKEWLPACLNRSTTSAEIRELASIAVQQILRRQGAVGWIGELIALSPKIESLKRDIDTLGPFLDRWDQLYPTCSVGHPFSWGTFESGYLKFLLRLSEHYGSLWTVLTLSDRIFRITQRDKPSDRWYDWDPVCSAVLEALPYEAAGQEYRFSFVPEYEYETNMSYNGSYEGERYQKMPAKVSVELAKPETTTAE